MTTLTEKATAQWKDTANFLLGLWLIASPWLFGYTTQQTIAWTAWFTGIIIAVAAFAALIAFHRWEEWVNAILALWLIVSPYVLGLNTGATFVRNQVIVGLLVGILAIWAAITTSEATPRLTAGR